MSLSFFSFCFFFYSTSRNNLPSLSTCWSSSDSESSETYCFIRSFISLCNRFLMIAFWITILEFWNAICNIVKTILCIDSKVILWFSLKCGKVIMVGENFGPSSFYGK